MLTYMFELNHAETGDVLESVTKTFTFEVDAKHFAKAWLSNRSTDLIECTVTMWKHEHTFTDPYGKSQK